MANMEYVFGIGANCGNREAAVKDALDWLSRNLVSFVCSSVYETPPVGHCGSNYMNAVAAGRSSLSLEEMDSMCKDYERDHGRDAEARMARRVPIDIDIVMADRKILREKDYKCGFFKIGYKQLHSGKNHFLRPNLHVSSHVPVKGIVSFIKNWTLPISIIMGIVAYFVYVNIPWLDSTHVFVGKAVSVVQPLLIFCMLFLTFLSIGPHDLRLTRWHILIMLIQLVLFGALVFVLTLMENTGLRIVIESAMLCLLCPTATAAAVVTRKLEGSAADITSYTILINMAIALAAPALLPIAHPHPGLTFVPTFIMIIKKVFPLLICPLFLAWIVRYTLPGVQRYLLRYKDLPFYLWAVSLALAIAVTCKAIMHSSLPIAYMGAIVVATIICCIFQFYLGKIIGARYGSKIEGGQALGQKNTVFIIWLGYTFLTPVTSVAGGLYSIWHNIFNSYQLYQHRRRK